MSNLARHLLDFAADMARREFRPQAGLVMPSIARPAPTLDCENPDCWSPKGEGIRRELTLESGASMILTACEKCAHLIEGDPDVARVVAL